MKRIIVSILSAFILVGCSGGSPPPEFMSSEMYLLLEAGPVPTQITVDRLVQKFSEKGSVSWSSLSDTERMATAKTQDKVTGRENKVQLVLASDARLKKGVAIKRMVIDGIEMGVVEIGTFLAGMMQ